MDTKPTKRHRKKSAIILLFPVYKPAGVVYILSMIKNGTGTTKGTGAMTATETRLQLKESISMFIQYSNFNPAKGGITRIVNRMKKNGIEYADIIESSIKWCEENGMSDFAKWLRKY